MTSVISSIVSGCSLIKQSHNEKVATDQNKQFKVFRLSSLLFVNRSPGIVCYSHQYHGLAVVVTNQALQLGNRI